MIRRLLAACAAALGLRRAPTPERTQEREPTGDSCYSAEVEALKAELREPEIPRDVLDSAEDAVNDSFGLPAVWRCSCGGRPFAGDACPRCGGLRSETER